VLGLESNIARAARSAGLPVSVAGRGLANGGRNYTKPYAGRARRVSRRVDRHASYAADAIGPATAVSGPTLPMLATGGLAITAARLPDGARVARVSPQP